MGTKLTKKKFVTIVPHIENQELRKDTGQIPYHFHKVLGFDSTLVTYFYTLQGGRSKGSIDIPPTNETTIHTEYPYLSSEVPGLKLHFLKNKGRGKFYEKSIADYIKKNSRSIDILNLFHFNTENIFYSILYKLLNPKGKIYLKLDIDLNYYKSRPYFFNTNSILFPLKKIVVEKLIYRLFFSVIDVLSAESKLGLDYFKNRFNVQEKKMLIIPNGVDKNRVNELIIQKPIREKENIIITVGRIGTAEKNNKLLLDALKVTDLKDWKVFFIGKIEPAFEKEIAEFYRSNPSLSERVIFTGKINDPVELYEYYNNAKVFCLTSREEGFPLSACEAAFFGNYLILSDSIYGFNELSNNGQFGVSLNCDISQFSQSIQFIINQPPEYLISRCDGIKKYADEKLCWQSIIPNMKNKLS